MVTARKIRCLVVVAETDSDGQVHYTQQPRFRPSDLLPWADPHIRSLVEQLQDEVRDEQAARRQTRPSSSDLERWAELDDELLGAGGGSRRPR
ncbi:hypothetical protein [Botrimarina sp.]|uniref:hypothetical protein n=1 Tax=Botrimarina sp. TaxID=2795802 RepID=UPI0032EE74A3